MSLQAASVPSPCRRQLLAAMAVGLALLPAAAFAALPKVNLQLQWRWVDVEPAPAEDDSPIPGVVVGTSSLPGGRTARTWRLSVDDGGPELLQQLTMRNGGRARLHLAQTQSVPWLEMAVLPQGRAAALRHRWVQGVSAMAVRASWPGGQRSVDVELQAETGEGAVGSPVQRTLATQLLVPRGQWVTVARSVPGWPVASSSKAPATSSGVRSFATRDAERRPQRELQLRIDALDEPAAAAPAPRAAKARSAKPRPQAAQRAR